MYRLFAGPARILGIRNRRRNCKGFDGELGTVECGTPGWMPNLATGRAPRNDFEYVPSRVRAHQQCRAFESAALRIVGAFPKSS